jgi:hypothetical protein
MKRRSNTDSLVFAISIGNSKEMKRRGRNRTKIPNHST